MTNALFEVRLNSIVLVEIVAGLMSSIKLIVTAGFLGTPVAPPVGLMETTVGDVVSAIELVVKDEVSVVSNALPAKSVTRGSVAPPNTLTV